MALNLTCPACAKALVVNEAVAGKLVRCSRCQYVFTAPPPEDGEPVLLEVADVGDKPLEPVIEAPPPIPPAPPTKATIAPDPFEFEPPPPVKPAPAKPAPTRSQAQAKPALPSAPAKPLRAAPVKTSSTREPVAPRPSGGSKSLYLGILGGALCTLLLGGGGIGAWALLKAPQTPPQIAQAPAPPAVAPPVAAPVAPPVTPPTVPVEQQTAPQPKPPTPKTPPKADDPVEEELFIPATPKVKAPPREPPAPPPAQPPGQPPVTVKMGIRTIKPLVTLPALESMDIQSLHFALDGKYLVVGAPRGVRRWDLFTFREAGRLYTNASQLAVSPDGTKMATAGFNQPDLWDIATLKRIKSVPAKTTTCLALAFSPDGKTLAVSDRLPVRLVSLDDDRVQTLPFQKQDLVDELSFSPDGKKLAGAGTIALRWDLDTQTALPAYDGAQGALWRVRYSHDGKLLAAGGHDGTVILWDTAKGTPKRVLSDKQGPITGVIFSPDDHVLVTCSGGSRSEPTVDPIVRVWHVATGALVARLDGHEGGLRGIALSPDGLTVAAGSTNGVVKIWDISSVYGKGPSPFNVAIRAEMKRVKDLTPEQKLAELKQPKLPDINAPKAPAAPPQIPPVDVVRAKAPALKPIIAFDQENNVILHSMAFGPGGKSIIAAGPSVLTRWDMTKLGDIRVVNTDVMAMAVSRDGQKVLTSDGKTIVLRDGATLNKTRDLAARPNFIPRALAFSFDGASAAFSDRAAQWIAIADDKTTTLPTAVPEVFDDLAFSPDGKMLAGGGRGAVRWDLENKAPLPSLGSEFGHVWRVRFSNDGKTLVTGVRDGTVRLYNVATGQLQRTLNDAQGPVSGIVFTPDDKYLITSSGGIRVKPSEDPAIRIWNASTGELVARLEGHNGGIRAVDLAPDGVTVAALSTKNSMRLWDISSIVGKPPSSVAAAVKALDPLAKVGPAPKAVDPLPVAPPPAPAQAPPPVDEPLAPGQKNVKLPDRVNSLVTGGGGRFIAMRCANKNLIAVYDVAGDSLRTANIPEEKSFIAAGQDKLMVYAPIARVLQRFDLKTLKLEAAVPLDLGGKVSHAVMGSASQGPLYLFVGNGVPAKAINPLTLKEETAPRPKSDVEGGIWRVSGDGRVFTRYFPEDQLAASIQIPKGAGYISYYSRIRSRLTPGAEGKYIYSAQGLLTPEGKAVGKMGADNDGSRFTLPAAEGETFYLSFDAPGFPRGLDHFEPQAVRLHLAGDDRPFATLDLKLKLLFENAGRGLPPDDMRCFLVPSAKKLVHLPPLADILQVHPVDPDELLKKSAHEYLLITSRPPQEAKRGQKFEYTPAIKSHTPTKIKLDSGPDGLTLDPTTGTLTWPVPPNYTPRDEAIVLTITNSAGMELFHIIRLAIVGP